MGKKTFLEGLLTYWYTLMYLTYDPLCPISKAQENCFKFQEFCTFLPLCMTVINTSLDFSIIYQRCNSKCKPLCHHVYQKREPHLAYWPKLLAFFDNF